MTIKRKIAVLGAGPMGLAVSYQLAKEGFQPVIYEAADRVGGLSASINFAGISLERFYHFHCVSDQAFLEILEELGLSQEIKWVETKMGFWYKNSLQEWGSPLALLKFKGISFISKMRYGLHAFICTKRKNWDSLDGKSATSWIRYWVGKEAYEVLWRRLFEFKFYRFSEKVSAQWIWARVKRIGNSRYSIFKERLGFLSGGSELLLNSIVTFLKKNN